jgi:hypothetical protein
MQFNNITVINYNPSAYVPTQLQPTLPIEFVCIGVKSGEVILDNFGNGQQLTNLVSESQLVASLSANTVTESEQADIEGAGRKGGKSRKLHRIKHHSAMGRAYGRASAMHHAHHSMHHSKGGNLEMNVSVPNDKNFRF